MNWKEFERTTGVKIKWWQKICVSIRHVVDMLNPNSNYNRVKKFKKFCKKIHNINS